MILLGSACIRADPKCVHQGRYSNGVFARRSETLLHQFVIGGTEREIAQARDRNDNEQVRPQFESAFQTVYS